jgi:hypothetical protein
MVNEEQAKRRRGVREETRRLEYDNKKKGKKQQVKRAEKRQKKSKKRVERREQVR